MFNHDARSGHRWALQKNIGCGSIPGSERGSGHRRRANMPQYLLLLKVLCQASRLPVPRQSPNQFIEFFLKEIKRNHYDCLFPMEEETLLLLVKYHSEISQIYLPSQP